MKAHFKVFVLVLLVVCMLSLRASQLLREVTRKQASDEVIFQVFPQSFFDDKTSPSSNPHDAAASKPRLVFHIGPGKMGSSSIQTVLKKSKKALHQDGWTNYNYVDLANLNRCIRSNECSFDKEKFENFFRRMEQDKRDIVLSTEIWTDDWRELDWYKHLLMFKNTYDITVVIAHRRYFNWLPSKYYQSYRYYCGENHAFKVQEGPIPSFNEYLRATPLFEHPTVRAFKSVSANFDTIQVVDIERDDIVQNLFCKILGAKETCKGLQSANATTANKGKTLTFDRLAQQVIQNGMADTAKINMLMEDLRLQPPKPNQTQTDCAKLAMILEEQDGRSGNTIMNDFPLICPPLAVMDILFNVSVEAERIFFQKHSHIAIFWKTFCPR